MLALVNTSLVERTIAAQFVAMIYAIWDDDERTLQISNSGLPRPIYCHEGKIEVVQATGLPLGFFDDAEFEEFWLAPSPGDICVLFSDGIIDARNRAGHSFGRERTEQIISRNCNASAEKLLKAIFDEVAAFSEGVPTFDDQTVIVLKLKERASGTHKKATRSR